MPPSAPTKNQRLYTIESLIGQKANDDDQPRKAIVQELCEILDITRGYLYKIYKSRAGGKGYELSATQMIKIAAYFNCTVDDLLNKDLHASLPVSTSDQNASSDAGHFNSIDNEE